MEDCFHAAPNSRPSFSTIVQILEEPEAHFPGTDERKFLGYKLFLDEPSPTKDVSGWRYIATRLSPIPPLEAFIKQASSTADQFGHALGFLFGSSDRPNEPIMRLVRELFESEGHLTRELGIAGFPGALSYLLVDHNEMDDERPCRVVPLSNGVWETAAFLRDILLRSRISHPGVARVRGWTLRRIAGETSLVEVSHQTDNCWPSQYLNDRVTHSHGLAAIMEYLHSRGIVHGDLQFSNISFNSEFGPVVLRFGSLIVPPNAPPNPFRAPELCGGGVCDKRSDVYSFRVMIRQWSIGSLESLAATMCDPDPSKRPSFAEICRHYRGLVQGLDAVEVSLSLHWIDRWAASLPESLPTPRHSLSAALSSDPFLEALIIGSIAFVTAPSGDHKSEEARCRESLLQAGYLPRSRFVPFVPPKPASGKDAPSPSLDQLANDDRDDSQRSGNSKVYQR
jgi:serine/threonine protein kinase